MGGEQPGGICQISEGTFDFMLFFKKEKGGALDYLLGGILLSGMNLCITKLQKC